MLILEPWTPLGLLSSLTGPDPQSASRRSRLALFHPSCQKCTEIQTVSGSCSCSVDEFLVTLFLLIAFDFCAFPLT